MEDQASVTRWCEETFGPVTSNLRIAQRAREELDELVAKLEANDDDPQAAVEVADIFIVLFRLATRLGSDVREEIDRKMKVNRARKWNLDGTGCGYHVRQQTQ